MSEVPEGWTDDMTLVLPDGITHERVADFVLDAAVRGESQEWMVAALVQRGLSEDDAALAVDRTYGGVVRAQTRNPLNAPPQDKDPVAWASFQRCQREPGLMAILDRPDPGMEPPTSLPAAAGSAQAPKKWWQFWRSRGA